MKNYKSLVVFSLANLVVFLMFGNAAGALVAAITLWTLFIGAILIDYAKDKQ